MSARDSGENWWAKPGVVFTSVLTVLLLIKSHVTRDLVLMCVLKHSSQMSAGFQEVIAASVPPFFPHQSFLPTWRPTSALSTKPLRRKDVYGRTDTLGQIFTHAGFDWNFKNVQIFSVRFFKKKFLSSFETLQDRNIYVNVKWINGVCIVVRFSLV